MWREYSRLPCLQAKCGTAFLAFGGGKEGAEACAAIDALNDVAAIDTLLSNFIIPLQSDNLRGKEAGVMSSTSNPRVSLARLPDFTTKKEKRKKRHSTEAHTHGMYTVVQIRH